MGSPSNLKKIHKKHCWRRTKLKKSRKSTSRLHNLNGAINNFEHYFIVQYRPDRPKFHDMVDSAEEFAMKILEPQIKAMIAAGDLDEKEWVV